VAQEGTAAESRRYAEQAQIALAQGHYEEAEKAFEKLRALEPGVAEVHANLGLVYFQERKFEQAVPALRQALKLKPGLVKSENLLTMSLSELGHYGEAAPNLEKCFRGSSDAEIKRMCGLQLLRADTGLRRDSRAVEVALELNRSYGDDPEVLYHTGKIFGNYAFLTMQKLAQVAPASVWRHQTEAEAYESQGSNDAAISEYQQVLSVDPGRPGIHYRLGRTLLARSRQSNSPDDLAAAAKEFEKQAMHLLPRENPLDRNAGLGQPAHMLEATGGREDFHRRIPQVEPLLQEGDEDLVLFVRSVEESANMAARIDYRFRELHGLLRDDHSCPRVCRQRHRSP